MKPMKRATFYPTQEVQRALEGGEPKKASARINELILKGLTKEREDQIKADYERYSHELSEPRKKDKQGISITMMMASGLFTSEDEPEDWF